MPSTGALLVPHKRCTTFVAPGCRIKKVIVENGAITEYRVTLKITFVLND